MTDGDETVARVVPVILAGGAGTRLWPLSRRAYPKQFNPLVGETSLYQAALTRFSGPGEGEGEGVDFAPPLVVTGSDYRFIAAEQLAQTGIAGGRVVIEPEGRNTAPAILAAACLIARDDPGALMLVSPSDHLIPDAAAMRRAVASGIPAAREGSLVTFGIRPHRPETGYGYLDLGEDGGLDRAGAEARGHEGARPLARFVEKPDAARAEAMLAETGRYLWNAGLFLLSVSAVRAAFAAHAPDLVAPVEAAVDGAETDLDFLRLDPGPWAGLRSVSVDYAVMEPAAAAPGAVAAVPFEGDWSDLGGWDAVHRAMGPDADGVSTRGDVTAIDCADTLLRSETPDMRLVGLGLKDILVVATRDAVLVADAGRAQDVGLAVKRLAAEGVAQAETFPRDYRPWGWYETLALSPRFQVKRIVVKPGAALSLQSHVHRSEHWVVVSGTARVTVDDDIRLVTENESVYIPLGATHRLENPGKVAMVLIEVQTGVYLGEDDIVRYQDDYARN